MLVYVWGQLGWCKLGYIRLFPYAALQFQGTWWTGFHLIPCNNKLCYKVVLATNTMSHWQQKENPVFEGNLKKNAQMLQMSHDTEGEWGRPPAKTIRRGGQICMSCAKASTLNSGKMIHLQYGALFFGIFLKKQWKSRGFKTVSIPSFCSPFWSAEGLFLAFLPSYFEEG